MQYIFINNQRKELKEEFQRMIEKNALHKEIVKQGEFDIMKLCEILCYTGVLYNKNQKGWCQYE